MRAVVDTNIFLAGLLNAEGGAAKLSVLSGTGNSIS